MSGPDELDTGAIPGVARQSGDPGATADAATAAGRDSKQHLSLDEVLRDLRDVPSMPAIVIELMTTMDQADVSFGHLAERISLDQALAAKTLRLANSSFYGMPSRVSTVQQAVTILGFGTVRALVTAASITGAFGRIDSASFPAEQFWQQSIATAVCAKNLAPELNLVPETAFVAGLLHDIGHLVMAVQCPEHYAAVQAWRSAHDCALPEAERAVTGITHADVGAALARHWRFPKSIVDAVAQHHAACPVDGLALAVHLADTLAHAMDMAGDASNVGTLINDGAWARLSLKPARLASMLKDIQQEYESICNVLVR